MNAVGSAPLLDHLVALSSCWNAGALTTLFRDELARRGFGHFNCGEVDLADPTRSVFVVTNWPDEFTDFYTREIVGGLDPVVDAMSTRLTPFSWAELRSERKSPEHVRVIDAMRDFGWTEGLGIPLPRGGSRRGVISLAGDRPALSPEERSELSVLSTVFYERLRSLTAGQSPSWNAAGLTPRELEALRWVSAGLSDAAIGDRMRIKASTVHYHVERSKRKLRAKTRAQAVAVAVSLGLVAL